MNMWGLTPEFMEILEKGFREFLAGLNAEDIKKEYLLPDIIDRLIKAGTAKVDVLENKRYLVRRNLSGRQGVRNGGF